MDACGTGPTEASMSDTTGDSVPRRAAFEAAHPNISVTPPGPGTGLLWIARDRDRGVILASDYWLGSLLDTLDWLTGGDR
jgi:hypothetical protein